MGNCLRGEWAWRFLLLCCDTDGLRQSFHFYRGRKNIIGPLASISSNSFVKQFAAIPVTVFNFANFDLPGTALNGLLTGAAGQINGTTPMEHNVDQVGVGTGVYSLGAPRQLEFGLRITF